jgi:hypothetical protein
LRRIALDSPRRNGQALGQKTLPEGSVVNGAASRVACPISTDGVIATRMALDYGLASVSMLGDLAVSRSADADWEPEMSHESSSRLLLFAAVALSASCSQVRFSEPAANPESAEPVLCASKAQCDVYWQRAQAWVANNSQYRLQTTTDAVIETDGPVSTRTALAFRITKVPDNVGGARIYAVSACGNLLGCSPTPTEAVAAFKRFVRN